MPSRAYSVMAGDMLKDTWTLSNFANKSYHLCVYGPNGFFREFAGDASAAAIDLKCTYEKSAQTKRLSGNIVLLFRNNSAQAMDIEVIDNAYQAATLHKNIAAGPADISIVVPCGKNHHWYDFSVKIKGRPGFLARYAGHIETGDVSTSDPAMAVNKI